MFNSYRIFINIEYCSFFKKEKTSAKEERVFLIQIFLILYFINNNLKRNKEKSFNG